MRFHGAHAKPSTTVFATVTQYRDLLGASQGDQAAGAGRGDVRVGREPTDATATNNHGDGNRPGHFWVGGHPAVRREHPQHAEDGARGPRRGGENYSGAEYHQPAYSKPFRSYCRDLDHRRVRAGCSLSPGGQHLGFCWPS